MKVNVSEKDVVITENCVINQGEFCVNVCEFLLPEAFDGLNVSAVFNSVVIPVLNGKCYIPSLKSGNCVLGVFAYKKGDSGLELVYSPKPTAFWVGKGSFTEEDEMAEIPEIPPYEEYLRMVQKLWQEMISNNTLPQYNTDATVFQYYSAAVINEMYLDIKGALKEVSELLGGATE